MSSKILVIASVIGAGLFVYGAVSDPFALPFPDFDDLPTLAKLEYFRAAATARYIRYGGAALCVLPAAWLWFVARNKRPSHSSKADGPDGPRR